VIPIIFRILWLRSSRARSDRKPAVEVQQCPLRAEVGEKRRISKAEVDVEVEIKIMEEKEERKKRKKKGGGNDTIIIKFSNPYLINKEI
jgi:hypothetical protein